MSITNIYVEGAADKKFIKDYVTFLFGIELKDNRIQETGDGIEFHQKKNQVKIYEI